MRQGDFSDEEFRQTKVMFKNQLLEMLDSANGMIEFFYNGAVAGRERQIDDWFRGIDEVTREDIVTVANKVQLDTTYFLKGKEESR